MKAVIYDKKARPGKLLYREVQKPIPDENEILIKVYAVSVNAADYRSMKMGLIPKRKIFGSDIAGIIEQVGKNVVGFKPGDEVIGELANYGFGGFAEYAVAPEAALVKKPNGVSFEEAASLPISANTALQALTQKALVQKGKKVLIVGSGGGVGTFAVQLAKYFGAEITGVCGPDNVEQTLALGANYAIDYSKENVADNRQKYDIILAINGNYPLTAYKRMLTKYGVYVMVGGSLTQIFKSMLLGWAYSLGTQKFKFLAAKLDIRNLEFLANLVAEGHLKPVIERIYTLEQTVDAMDYLSKGHAKGKVIIKVL